MTLDETKEEMEKAFLFCLSFCVVLPAAFFATLSLPAPTPPGVPNPAQLCGGLAWGGEGGRGAAPAEPRCRETSGE